jgi:hypothetical protein
MCKILIFNVLKGTLGTIIDFTKVVDSQNDWSYLGADFIQRLKVQSAFLLATHFVCEN